jgi:serine/threonine protein kinase
MLDSDVRREEAPARALEQAAAEYWKTGRIDLVAWQARHPDLADDLAHLLRALLETETAVLDCPAGAAEKQDDEGDQCTLLWTLSAADTAEWPPAPEPMPMRLGRYEVRDRIGRGGMATVYRAHDPELRRDVAIKVPRFDGPGLDRFRREARAAAAVRHPHVCPVYDVGEIEAVPFAVMAFIEGTTLAQLVAAGPLEPGRAVEVVRQVAEGLAVVHAHGIVHRDLKPANILIDRTDQALLTDFGLALCQGNPCATDGTLAGTPAYMAPEQAAGKLDEVGPLSDVYSLGAVLYELLTGRPPFRGDPVKVVNQVAHAELPPPSRFRPDLGPALESIILTAMARRPRDRYPSAAAFAEALATWQSTEGTAPPPAVPPNRCRVPAGMMLVLRNREGKVIQRIPVPPGHSISVEPGLSGNPEGLLPPY